MKRYHVFLMLFDNNDLPMDGYKGSYEDLDTAKKAGAEAFWGDPYKPDMGQILKSEDDGSLKLVCRFEYSTPTPSSIHIDWIDV